MDYEGSIARSAQMQGAGILGNTVKPVPELGRLKGASELVALQANRLESFIARFHGSKLDFDEGSDCDKPVGSYRNDLSTLFAQIERLEKLVSALDDIG
jgi:hypothetical protein